MGSLTNDIISSWHQSMYDEYVVKRSMYRKRAAAAVDAEQCLVFPRYTKPGFNMGVKLQIKCSVQDYFAKEVQYSQRMCQMTAVNLSADHTFKIAANIGIMRDGKWIKMFDSLFLILSEVGVVMSWALCKGTKFVAVEASFRLLKARLDRLGCEIKLIAIDNCCKWGMYINQTFRF